MVLVTHDLREALKLAQELLVLDHGQVVQHGPCDEIINAPAGEFVKKFFRSQLEA